MDVVAVLEIHMDRNQVAPIRPSINLARRNAGRFDRWKENPTYPEHKYCIFEELSVLLVFRVISRGFMLHIYAVAF